jgi:hypothetical protein
MTKPNFFVTFPLIAERGSKENNPKNMNSPYTDGLKENGFVKENSKIRAEMGDTTLMTTN